MSNNVSYKIDNKRIAKNSLYLYIRMFFVLIIGFLAAFVVDPITLIYMKVQHIDTTSIKNISERYMKDLGVIVDKPIIYRFVRYKHDKGLKADSDEEILLGTFHEWNGKYYIDISVDLYKLYTLDEIVIHETRHMLVDYLKDKNIINLSKYSEDIAQEKNIYYNKIFNYAIKLLENSED